MQTEKSKASTWTPRNHDLKPVYFVILEALIFTLYYIFTIFVNNDTYLLYLIGIPGIMGAIILLDRTLTESLSRAFVATDFIVLVATLSFWFFLYAYYGFGRDQVLVTLYAPVIIEEVNFRFIMMEYIGRHIGREKALVIQALLFGLWYGYYELFYQGTYPNIFLSFVFIVSMVSIGAVYGVIYYFRKNVYITMSLHLSLLLLALPVVPWYVNLVSYLMGPT